MGLKDHHQLNMGILANRSYFTPHYYLTQPLHFETRLLTLCPFPLFFTEERFHRRLPGLVCWHLNGYSVC